MQTTVCGEVPLGRPESIQAMQWIVYWGLSAIAGALLAAAFAGYKNRDISSWVGWCFLLPPLAILLLILPKRAGPRPRQPRLDEIDRNSGMS